MDGVGAISTIFRTEFPIPPYLDMKDNSELIGSLEKQLTYCARLFTGDFDDLMQVGRLALLRALSTWREESAFWTFARLHVLSDMKRFVLAERKKSLSLIHI